MADIKGSILSPNSETKQRVWFSSIRSRIYFVILVTVMPIVLGLSYHIWQKYNVFVNTNIAEARGIVSSTVQYDQDLLHQAAETLKNIVYVPAIRNENWRVCSDYLKTATRNSEQFLNMGVIDVSGKLVCSGRSKEKNFGEDFNHRKYFNDALKKIDITVSDYLNPGITGVPKIAVVLRVPSYNGITIGVGFVLLNLDWLHIENEWSLMQPDSKIWVLDRNGTVLHHMPNGVDKPRNAINGLSELKLDAYGMHQFKYVDKNNKTWLSFIKPVSIAIEKNVLYVRYDVPESYIYSQANNYLKLGIGSLVLLLLFAAAIAWISVQLAAGKSLDKLRQAVIKLGNNDFDTRIGHLLQGKELQEIGYQFDKMAATIQKNSASLKQSELGYRMLFESIPSPMLVLSLVTGKILASNMEASRIYGYTKDEMLGMDLSVLRSSTIYDSQNKDFMNEHHIRKDGKPLFVEVRNLSLLFRGESANVLLIRDVTDRETLSFNLKERDRLISNLFDVTVEAICGLDASGFCIFANKACAKLLGYDSHEALLGKHFHSLAHYKYEDGTPYLLKDCRMYKNLQQGQRTHVDNEVLWRRDGTCFPVEYWTYPIWRENELDFCIVTFLDITDRVQQQRALSYQAKHDSLTGLYNRSEIYRHIDDSITNQPDQQLVMVIANIDNFKEVNESLGHDIGDLLLQCVADRLRKILKPEAKLSRVGSDEYVFLLPDCDLVYAYEYVENITHLVREPFVLSGLQIRTSMSIGLSHYNAHADNAQDLFRFADIARRKAKKDSLGIAIYDISYSEKTHERLLLRSEILTALEQEQFMLYLQPKIFINNKNNAKGDLIGFEALTRWQHPKRGLLYPDVFIPIIEASDLIHDFTKRLLTQSVFHCMQMQAIHPGIRVAINVSVKNLTDNTFATQVQNALNNYKLDPNLLELEVTESSLMADPDQAVSTLNALSDLGVRISIDDFGTGYSSFAYLSRLPIDVLKIDKSFIFGMAKDKSQLVIVKSIIDMAHTLGINVVAEGIETAAALSTLYDMGCDAGQGYFIAKPMPVEKSYEWLSGYQPIEI